jgi:hypothetical protein
MNSQAFRVIPSVAIFAAALFSGHAHASSGGCPNIVGWTEGFPGLAQPGATFPINDTANLPTPDCNFQQWSWEAFVWATAVDSAGVPRFLELPTLDDLTKPGAVKTRKHKLRLATRSVLMRGEPGFKEGTGAIVEADGGMLVAPNGYPVYASVHMNPSYLAVAKKNLVSTGGYSNPKNGYFNPGDAVFKATWLRLAPGQKAPDGAYTTEAEVPVLIKSSIPGRTTVQPDPTGKTTTVTVALVGLHVVGYTVNHPEFLWATFEHKDNTPRTPDGSTPGAPDPKSYTFYTANTAINQTNCENIPAAYSPPATCQPLNAYQTFDPSTQLFSPTNNAWLLNKTGGENNVGGVANIEGVNQAAQTFLKSTTSKQLNPIFANYDLIGTLWLPPNFYVDNNKGVPPTDLLSNSQGSIELANTTAETYEQQSFPSGPVPHAPSSNVQNCFMCHNPTISEQGLPPLPSRRVAISHVLEYGTSYAVPNKIFLPAGLPPLSSGAEVKTEKGKAY